MALGVSSANSSNMNSIYGNRNVISGLASGMDTESMIENAVSGIKTKISNLEKKRTSTQWKQEAMRDIISKMVGFSNKYASYTSTTNLLSSSFFNSAVVTTTNGTNASKVSATGKTSSEIIISQIKALATAGKGSVNANSKYGVSTGLPTITGTENVDLDAKMDLSDITGSMSLVYGNQQITLNFKEDEVCKTAQELADLIKKKLGDTQISMTGGGSKTGSNVIDVTVDGNGRIAFGDKLGAGNSVIINGATGDFAKVFGLKDASGRKPSGFPTAGVENDMFHETTTGKYLAGKEVTITLDGKSKTIKFPAFPEHDPNQEATFATNMNKELDKAFGAGKVKFSFEGWTSAKGGKMKFEAQESGSTMTVATAANKKLGLDAIATSYIDTGKKLGDFAGLLDGLTGKGKHVAAVGEVKKDDNGVFKDSQGNIVTEDQKNPGKYIMAEKDGKTPKEYYDLVINGETIGTYTKDTALETVMVAINSNAEAGVNVSYSRTTNQFQFSAKETGEANGVKIDGGLAEALFGPIDVKGTDAVFSMKVNGVDYDDVTRSDNSFDVDGLNITLNETFVHETKPKLDANGKPVLDADQKPVVEIVKKADPVTFTSKTDSDKIFDAVKGMIADYNEMMLAIKEQYGTLPAEKSNGSRYEPLTDEDKATMSESAIKAYEEKAKQGLLFADGDLSSLYNKMRGIFSSSGVDGSVLRSMGITTEYSAASGTTVKLDETKMRAMIENNPDVVRDAFVKSKDTGSETNGIMTNLKTQLDAYAKTTGDMGILINKSGSVLAPNSLKGNSLQKSMDNIDKEIERWQTKMADKIDLYTRKFTQLEKLIAEMNSQSSSLMGMMGGTG